MTFRIMKEVSVDTGAGHVTGVVDPEAVEWGSLGGHVVRPKQHRLVTDSSVAEPGSWPVGSADIERPPTTATSRSAGSVFAGRRIKVAIPP
jgi:hypothetical protein